MNITNSRLINRISYIYLVSDFEWFMFYSESSIVPKMNVVDPEPGEESRKHNHVLNTPVQTMYIMADLTPKGRYGTEQVFF